MASTKFEVSMEIFKFQGEPDVSVTLTGKSPAELETALKTLETIAKTTTLYDGDSAPEAEKSVTSEPKQAAPVVSTADKKAPPKKPVSWLTPVGAKGLIDHIQDAPAVSQQELRSYMLPWFSPFAAPWCGKIQRAFPKAYVTMNFELILVPRTNTYINLNHCSTPDEFKAEVIEGVSRFAFKAFTKPLCKEHLDGINKLLDTKFTPEDMEYIYTNLGNGINHELCMKFVKSGYDLKVIEESV